MSKDNVIAIKTPETFVDDPITEILRQGARKLGANFNSYFHKKSIR